jgi:hypothetical protein
MAVTADDAKPRVRMRSVAVSERKLQNEVAYLYSVFTPVSLLMAVDLTVAVPNKTPARACGDIWTASENGRAQTARL